jgi:hypothetical protein
MRRARLLQRNSFNKLSSLSSENMPDPLVNRCDHDLAIFRWSCTNISASRLKVLGPSSFEGIVTIQDRRTEMTVRYVRTLSTFSLRHRFWCRADAFAQAPKFTLTRAYGEWCCDYDVNFDNDLSVKRTCA